MYTVEQAQRRLLDASSPRKSSSLVLLDDALGQTLADDLIASVEGPPYDQSSMDGWVALLDDLHAPTLQIAGTITAGDLAEHHLMSGHAHRIMTGARVPAQPCFVSPREDVEVSADHIRLTARPEPHDRWIRRRGGFFAHGDRLLRAGASLGPGEIALLASQGVAQVRVYDRPRVSVITTGDELVAPGSSLAPAQLYNSNAPMLAAMVRRAGASLALVHHVPDDAAQIDAALDEALEVSDLVITSGGVSVGDFDLVRPALEARADGGQLDFWKILMKPGKPLTWGVASRADRTIGLLGLPGNPVSSFVCFELFAAPLLRALQHQPALPTHPVIRAVCAETIRGAGTRRCYVTGRLVWLDGSPQFTPLPNQDSGNLSILAHIDALAIVPEQIPSVEAGAHVEVLSLRR